MKERFTDTAWTEGDFNKATTSPSQTALQNSIWFIYLDGSCKRYSEICLIKKNMLLKETLLMEGFFIIILT